MTELTAISREAYRSLVERPGFAAFFRAATPIDLIAGLGLGSRPTARPGAARPGAGRRRGGRRPSAADDVGCAARDPVGVRVVAGAGQPARLVRARARRSRRSPSAAAARSSTTWATCTGAGRSSPRSSTTRSCRSPRPTSATFRRYADLAEGAEATAIRGMIEAEYARSVRLLLLVTGRDRLLAGHPDARPLDRAAQPLRRRAVGRPGRAARAAPRRRTSRRPTRRALRNVIGVDDQRHRGRAPEHRVSRAGGSGIVGACARSRRPSSSARARASAVETLRLDDPRAGRGPRADDGVGRLPLRPPRPRRRLGAAGADRARPRGRRRDRGRRGRASTRASSGAAVALSWYAPCLALPRVPARPPVAVLRLAVAAPRAGRRHDAPRRAPTARRSSPTSRSGRWRRPRSCRRPRSSRCPTASRPRSRRSSAAACRRASAR